MICPHCQAENKEGAKFCSECWTALTLSCPRCGASHRAGQKFCDDLATQSYAQCYQLLGAQLRAQMNRAQFTAAAG